MKKDLFPELLDSVREGGQVLKEARPASRKVSVGEPEVEGVRALTIGGHLSDSTDSTEPEQLAPLRQ